MAGQRQALRIRMRFFTALVRQDMTWYDRQSTGALAVRISQDIPKIQDAMSDKVPPARWLRRPFQTLALLHARSLHAPLLLTCPALQVGSFVQFLGMFLGGFRCEQLAASAPACAPAGRGGRGSPQRAS